MTTRKPVVLNGSQQQVIQAGDTIDPSYLPTAITGSFNTAQSIGAGPTLSTTEATIGSSVLLNGVDASSGVLILARCNPLKDANTTIKQATFRVRRGTANTDPQVGRDSVIESTLVASTPFGSAAILAIDTGHGGGSLTYSLRGFANVASGATTPHYEIVAIELKAPKGDTGQTGDPFGGAAATPVLGDLMPIYRPIDVAGYTCNLSDLAALLNPGGTWTPTGTANANVSAISALFGQFSYNRNAGIVFFTIQATVTPTVANTVTSLLLSLPPGATSAFAASTDACGVVASSASPSTAGFVRADTASGKLFCQITPPSTAAIGLRITGSFNVL